MMSNGQHQPTAGNANSAQCIGRKTQERLVKLSELYLLTCGALISTGQGRLSSPAVYGWSPCKRTSSMKATQELHPWVMVTAAHKMLLSALLCETRYVLRCLSQGQFNFVCSVGKTATASSSNTKRMKARLPVPTGVFVLE